MWSDGVLFVADYAELVCVSNFTFLTGASHPQELVARAAELGYRAIALTDVFWGMATAIFIGAMLMIWLSDGVASFLEKNRMYEVLGLFILLVVGIMLLTEGGHLAHLKLFDNSITPMTKTTFYFVITVLVLTDIVQSRYRKKLLAERAATEAVAAEA
mgnify:CR=1 FL=1